MRILTVVLALLVSGCAGTGFGAYTNKPCDRACQDQWLKR